MIFFRFLFHFLLAFTGNGQNSVIDRDLHFFFLQSR
jgi:hypothetical protein